MKVRKLTEKEKKRYSDMKFVIEFSPDRKQYFTPAALDELVSKLSKFRLEMHSEAF